LRRLLLVLLLAAAACRGRPAAPILNYHSVGPGGPPEFAVTEADFARQLDWLASAGFHTISLHELADRRRTDHGVVLTFDDGTEDALTRVLPALQKRGMSGAFFIATGLIGTPGHLTWAGVRALAAAGMEVGSHTVSHARLADLDDAGLRRELAESKRELEAQLGRPVDLLAYPFNSVRARVRTAAEEAGYRIGVSGTVHGGGDLIDLRRVTVRQDTTFDEFKRAVEVR
jgi:peptidoglycan/xylan/chitin deacetylase (PgdA/CDA1 family)